jgi:methyltransferase
MRHPNYLAVIIEIACVPMIRGCWITAMVFSIANAVLLRTRILTEEVALGPRYSVEFSGRLRLIPKPPPRTARHDAHGRARRGIAQRR